MCGLFGGGGGDGGAAEDARKREAKRRKNIQVGTQSIEDAFSGFNDDYFGERSGAYSSYATPQLEEQFADAKRQLAFALSRKGLTSSTAAADQQRRLNEQYSKFQTDVANAATNYSNKSRLDIENARGDLLAELNATEDPAAAASSATRRAELFSKPPAFDPLERFVFEIASGLEGQSAANGYQGVVKSPLFGGNSAGGVRYVG